MNQYRIISLDGIETIVTCKEIILKNDYFVFCNNELIISIVPSNFQVFLIRDNVEFDKCLAAEYKEFMNEMQPMINIEKFDKGLELFKNAFQNIVK